MKRIAVCAALLVAGCNPTPQQQPVQAQPHATKLTIAARTPAPIKPQLDCKTKDSTSGKCKAYAAVQGAFDDIQTFEASMFLDAGRKKHEKPMSLAGADGGRLAGLDAATAGITDPNVKALLSQLRTMYGDCESKIYLDYKAHPTGILDDAFDADEVKDSCAFGIQRQADAIGVALGIQVARTPPDIFGMTWGLSMADALKVNSKPIERDADSLVYDSTINGSDANVVLTFTNGSLSRVFYILKSEHANPLPYIGDFEVIDGLLKDKYGAPSISGPQWADDLYKDDHSQWGMAVATHRMQMRSEWQTPRTKIVHFLSGDNFKINHVISYQSRELALATKRAARDQHKGEL